MEEVVKEREMLDGEFISKHGLTTVTTPWTEGRYPARSQGFPTASLAWLLPANQEMLQCSKCS